MGDKMEKKPVGFGKHRLLTVVEIMEKEPDYVRWCLSQGNPSAKMRDLIKQVVHERGEQVGGPRRVVEQQKEDIQGLKRDIAELRGVLRQIAWKAEYHAEESDEEERDRAPSVGSDRMK